MTKRILPNIVMGMLTGLLLTGCASPARKMALPDLSPVGAKSPAVGQRPQSNVGSAGHIASEPAGPVSLEQVLAAALLQNPELSAFSSDVRSAEARVRQARLLPNPELEVAVEEYDRGGAGFESAETAVVLGQLIELGGKRRCRTRLAEAEGELSRWDYESQRLGVFAETTRRFTEVLAAQQRIELAILAVGLAEKTSRAVEERVKAGKEPPLYALKSEAELELVRMRAQGARSALDVARNRLAAMWGAERAAFGNAEGNLEGILGSVPSLNTLQVRLSTNPTLARWESELRLRQAALSLEKAARIPNLEASMGFLQFEEDGTDALAFGIGMPLPIFDRNQGNVAAAKHELASAEAARSAAELTLTTELGEIHAALTAAHQRVTVLRSKVVPTMEQAYEAALSGYEQGKFGLLEVLDAQRGLFDAKGALVDALSDYHIALADIQRTTGASVKEPDEIDGGK